MEAITRITSLRELLACCPEYWESGRQAMTDDVVAAAEGLLDGGADEVVVLDNHGSGHPENVIVDQLPDRVRAESWNVFDLPAHGVDGMLQVGYHPRAEQDGFAPHTYIPGLRLWVGDEEISESHGRIWAARTRLVGISGHARHEQTLGSLAGVPYLVVQDGTDRARADAMLPRDEARSRLRAFARETLRSTNDAVAPVPPHDVLMRARVRDATETQAATMAAGGWAQHADEEFSVELATWPAAREPIAAAMAAAFEPFSDITRMDLGSPAALDALDPARREALAGRFARSL